MLKQIKYSLFILILICKNTGAQKLSGYFVDSLYAKAITEKKDTNQLLFLFTECSKITKKHPVETKSLLLKTLKLASSYNDKKWIAKSKSLLATLEYFTGNFTESEIYYKAALEIYIQNNYLQAEATTYNNMASLYRDKGEYNIAIDYYIKSLKIKEDLKDKKGIVNTLNNIANMHLMQSDNLGAEKYYNEAKTIAEELKDADALSMTYSNLANIYFDLNEVEKSYKYDTLALFYRKKLGDKSGISISLHNISSYFEVKKNFPMALKYINESLKIKEEIGDRQGVSVSKTEKGTIYLNMMQPDSAIVLFIEALDIAKQLSIKKRITICYQNLAKAYANKKNFEKAYSYERMYSELKDSITKESYQKNISEMETKYDTDKKKKEIELLTKEAKLNHLILRERELEGIGKAKEIELLNKENELAFIQNQKNKFEIENKKNELENTQKEISLLNQKKEIQELEIKNHQANIKQQKIVSYFVITGFLLAMGLAFFIFKGLKKQRQANKIISKQKTEVEEKNILINHQKELVEEHQKEILDSIHYAKRIQNTLLAHKDFVDENIPNNFIYFNPKDIVSGDFYWATKNGDKFFIAVCDSTGHGVPGAFMSLLNITFLNEAINEKGILETHEVFNFVRQRLIECISKEGQKDGFDGILVCIDKAENKITYTAANNKPIIISNGTITELIADRMPVGKGENEKSFTQNLINLQKDDILYLYTDGYADQFGGPKGKKFKYKQLNELLLSISSKQLTEQSAILEQGFNSWKRDLEQVDDVCLIGVKL